MLRALRTAAVIGAATALALFVHVVAASARTGSQSGPQITPIQVRPLAPVTPVLGADGDVHLAYELQISNLSDKTITFRSVEALDTSDDDAVLTSMDGATLAQTLRLDSGVPGTVLAPGAGGMLFTDVAVPATARVPRTVRHRFAYEISDATGTQAQDFVGVPQRVRRKPAVSVAPPLTGEHWVVANGCCAQVNAHRGATLPIDGVIHVPERFAVDFMQLDDQLKLFSGPADDVRSYPFFGTEVMSVAPGRVVRVQDGLPEQAPGTVDPNATVETAPGNAIVVDIGHGRYAYYAHLQSGSVRVAPGDRVTTGQVLGLLGNSGSSEGPHLHFHLMDGPSPLLADGLPFQLTSFVGEGFVTNPLGEVRAGGAAELDETFVGQHQNELPLDLQVIGFPRAAAGGGDARV